ncbi:hypothetical protein ACFQJ7_14460 [Halovenus rubra]|uniref:Uncharacterized protein n=2 Tax=Halovenus rubra TaxID=869890 RepID=A0ABD5X868_9EURY|nr:hypothetical protein [Halovenus rubra]
MNDLQQAVDPTNRTVKSSGDRTVGGLIGMILFFPLFIVTMAVPAFVVGVGLGGFGLKLAEQLSGHLNGKKSSANCTDTVRTRQLA